MSSSNTPAATPVSAVATPEEVETLRAEQEKEWNQYVAVAPITYNGALAYNVGSAVPASNVARHKYDEQGLVAKIGTKAANETIRALVAAATPEQSGEVVQPVSLNVSVPEGK